MTATMITVNMRPTQAVTTIPGAVCIEKVYVNQYGFCSMPLCIIHYALYIMHSAVAIDTCRRSNSILGVSMSEPLVSELVETNSCSLYASQIFMIKITFLKLP